MAHSALTPVFVGLRTGLHSLFVILVLIVMGRAVLAPSGTSGLALLLSAVLLGTYALGVFVARSAGVLGQPTGRIWLAVLTIEWFALLWLVTDAAYLVFPLFFLYLHLLGRRLGSAAIVFTTFSICALGLHNGWTVGGVVGPLVGAGVALLIGLGYQALEHESAQREALVQELLSARSRLAATEHEAGVLAERARLAREIHDTVAQGLSSIQMLLHAAERSDPDRHGVEHIQLARQTAAANLADTRRFIRELAPPELDDQGLGGALSRLAQGQWASQGLKVTVQAPTCSGLPMYLQTALLRIAQGAIANVIQHADATQATVTISITGRALTLRIVDDGVGFDPAHAFQGHIATSDSFGLTATQERVHQLGGTLQIDSAPGGGTTVTVELDLSETP
ncbi:sensor histidine kinase [Ornithinimicrobium sp. INDO-MA30-4]|uniref:sensor histidine kinase n=1 Tax=Ornithinimicrobium sp. INDO-MA30-4 TaxID=2908651 RepID=UPI001F3A6842|nr:sensor histidine kinase [Ornithinimicrobium sp. INDO-MA30-4]UJH70588.1 sensor histidine kinase [Ornithinimicrobium sp. INDO-MA30-4]